MILVRAGEFRRGVGRSWEPCVLLGNERDDNLLIVDSECKPVPVPVWDFRPVPDEGCIYIWVNRG